ncbi:hypothetical protein FN846DRAFT_992645 [Sphaerosporella brunnea]|uniref:Uncharacterized protein n=1 Tax=Sphaerosporella brunnea TaxID=1250544 RepID=A0A5J5FBM9_9PEZI|nr:hypothetical protein FN846DRAFT_992645 [Sphaerosporella brunnea]
MSLPNPTAQMSTIPQFIGAPPKVMSVQEAHRMASLQAAEAVFEILELMVTKGLAVVDLEAKLKMVFQFVLHKFEQFKQDTDYPPWMYETRDKLALVSLGRLVKQCLMVFNILRTYHEEIVQWQISAARQTREVRLQARAAYGFLEFCFHIDIVHQQAALTARYLEDTVKRALQQGTKEAENVSKRLVSALSVYKAKWIMQHTEGHHLALGDVDDFPPEVKPYLADWHKMSLSLDSVGQGRGQAPFNKILEWYLNSTRLVMKVEPHQAGLIRPNIKRIVDKYYPPMELQE